MNEVTGAVIALYEFREGSWKTVPAQRQEKWRPGDHLAWLHLDATHPDAAEWLGRFEQIDDTARGALLQAETRPRALALGNALLAILRGVNLNPGAEPEDMVSLRIWADQKHMVTTRRRRLMAVEDLRKQIERGHGPESTAGLIVALADRLVERMASVIGELDDRVDDLEQRMLQAHDRAIRSELLEIRGEAIALRRYLSPQREALSRLVSEDIPWVGQRHRSLLREITDRVTRYVEDLDAIRERSSVVQDELINRLSDQMNRNMYVLTIVATVMLPLGFLTGLLGINVDGMPGAQDSPMAFWTVCGGLAALVALEVWFFRRMGWF